MKDQVTSIEQSKRLIELGVPAEKASMLWDTISPASHPVLRIWDTSTDTKRWQVDRVGHVPAFTIADLLGILKPIHIFEILCYPCIERTKGNDGWMFEYGGMSGDEDFGYAQCNSLVDLLCDRIEWTVSNGYKLNI